MRKSSFFSVLATTVYLFSTFSHPVSASEITPLLRLPEGFKIEELASVPNARSMAMSQSGTLVVSSIRGTVYLVTDALGSNPEVKLFAEKLRIPNGIAVKGADLYVAEANRLLRYSAFESRFDAVAEPEVLADDLPGRKLHAWKYIRFAPNGRLYVTVGAPCNICNEPDFGLILSMTAGAEDREVYARGIRNTVGIAWHPQTGELWFTDNNRDMMGDDEPPGELNRAAEPGLHFGFPFCHGIDTVEPEAELAALGSCSESEPPALELPAHVAALGLAFYDGQAFPESYRNQVFIAEHGSWNRSEKIGYRVSLVRLDESGRRALSYEPFVEGWLREGDVLGRPVDLLAAPDGSLLISDDSAGKIYRVSYVGTQAAE
ncbi:MAG: PQQ-dependent sugar dehydrogenase [Gammaproteobacteria bacterium]|jgi:glucose/arabinose dehydrogenase